MRNQNREFNFNAVRHNLISLYFSIKPSPSSQQDVVFKFSQTPTTPEKIKKLSFSQKSPDVEPKRQIMPPPPRLRQSTSMAGLDTLPNGNFQNTSKVSQSTLNLNGAIVFETQKADGIKLKRKKWYSMFLPPHKENVKVEGIENDSLRVNKKKKRKWYKSKKDKIAVQVS